VNSARDYDKEPIIIKDKLPNIVFINMLIAVSIGIATVLTFIKIKQDLNIAYFISIFVTSWLGFFFILISKVSKDNKIIFTNNKIIRTGKTPLSINIANISSFKKTFIEFYDKSQEVLPSYRWIYTLLLPFSILIQHPMLIITKFIYKTICGLSNKSIIDTLMVFDDNNNFISVFVTQKNEFDELENYFQKNGLNIHEAEFYYTNQYSIDEVTSFFNNKRSNK